MQFNRLKRRTFTARRRGGMAAHGARAAARADAADRHGHEYGPEKDHGGDNMSFRHLKRREFLGVFTGAASWSTYARGQAAGKIPTIGVLWHAANAEEEKFPLSLFRQGMQDVDYVEGQNIKVQHRFPAEQPERFNALAAELVQLNVDIIFTITRLAALAAQRATKTIPIVFVAVADPVGSKLIESLARPGGNITGLANMALELTPKRFELLKEVVGLAKAALLVNATDSAGPRYVELSNTAVAPLGITVDPIEVRAPEDFEKAFSEIRKRGLQGVVTTQDGLIYNEQSQMFRLALQHKLPLIGYSREMAFNGALMSYGPNNATMFRRAGAFIDKILEGTKKVGDLPVEQPTKYELIINMKTAKAIGLDVPPILLSRADEVIE
jgi:putative ABC transport system substrate-binding protein